MTKQYKVKVIFSSSNSEFVEAEYGTGVAATWDSLEAAQEFANVQMKCFGLTYKVVEV